MAKDLASATSSDMTNNVSNYSVPAMNTDSAQQQKETEWLNANWTQYWGYFNQVPDLKSAIIMKAIWNVGKGYQVDNRTRAILDNINGWGKDTFLDIMFNMEVQKRINGDAYAEIIKNDDGELVNLKPLDPGTIKIIVNSKGIITRYEQVDKGDVKKVTNKFDPSEIFHLSHNRIADQIHGISDILGMEKTILAEEENFEDMKTIMHRQAKPFMIFKLKTDDDAKITEIISKIDKARNKGEDMYIPDDEDVISFEPVQINLQQAIFQWRNDIRNKFYRTIGLPQVVPGAGGQSTESESKVIYLAFEQIVEKEQREIEAQIWNQLALRINFLPPTTISNNLQTDQAKDGGQGFKPSDVTAGAGR